MLDNEELLKGYRESLKVAWGYNDYEDWPLRISSIMHLFTDVFAKEFIEDLNAIWDEENGPQQLAQIFEYPGRMFRLIDVVMFGLRRARTPLEEQRQFVVRMLRAAHTLKAGDLFNKNGANLLIHPDIPPKSSRKQGDSNLIHKLQAALFMYTEAILFRGHDAVKTVHGPYITADNTAIVIREFHNLSPTELWPSSLLINHKKITTVCEYMTSAEVKVDCYDHIYHSGKLNQSLLSWHVTIDGESVDTEQISAFVDALIAKTRQVSGIVDEWTWQQKTEKYADIFWFRKSPLRELRGLSSKVPDHVYETIRNGKPSEIRSKCLSPREVAFLIQLGV